MIFKIYKGNKVQTETIKAVSDCSENGEDIENLRSTMSLMYALIWVISLSFLPVFPDSHSLPLTLTIVFYITISLAF